MNGNWFNGERIVESESPVLTHIDGFLVTDGDSARMTLRSQLSREEKEQVRKGLMRYLTSDGQPGIYLWDAGQCFVGDERDIEFEYDA